MLSRKAATGKAAKIINRTNITGECLYLIKYESQYEKEGGIWHQDVYKLAREDTLYLFKKEETNEEHPGWDSDDHDETTA